jgi:peptidoglycan-associated lipoprotein
MRFIPRGTLPVIFAVGVAFSPSAFGQTAYSRTGPAIELDAPPFQGVKDDAKLAHAPTPQQDEQEQFQQAIKDIHFDFDRADLRDQDRQVLESDADWLKAHPDVLIRLEGEADDRGDILYNLVLSGERAETTRQALLRLGVPDDRIAFSTGWGELYPVCTQAEESCWSQNRRTHIGMWPPPQTTRTSSSAMAEK